MLIEHPSFSGLEGNGKKHTRQEVQEIRKAIFRNAPEEHRARLTPRQQDVLDLLFPSGGQKPLQEVEIAVNFHVTLQAVCNARDRGVKRLERQGRGEPEIKERKKSDGPPRLEMTPQEREHILAHRDSSATAISEALRHSQEIIGRWFDDLGVSRKPVGRPPRKKA